MDEYWTRVIQALPALVVLLVLYWVYLRPLRRQVLTHRKLLSKLKAGDAVITEGGMLGKVEALVEPDIVRIWISPDRSVALKRSGIAEVVDEALVDKAWTQEP